MVFLTSKSIIQGVLSKLVSLGPLLTRFFETLEKNVLAENCVSGEVDLENKVKHRNNDLTMLKWISLCVIILSKKDY